MIPTALTILWLMLANPYKLTLLDYPHVKSYLTYEGYDTYTFFRNTEYKDVAKYIVALEIIESGWGTSKRHLVKNNTYSLYMIKDGKAMMRPFPDRITSMWYLYVLFKRRKYSTDVDNFLLDIYRKGYASELPDHPERLRRVGDQIYKYLKYYD